MASNSTSTDHINSENESPSQPPLAEETNANKKYSYTTLLLDMDGVLAEVSKSYRVAILQTCHSYGATKVTQNIITEWKARGNANDDWKLSYDLIQQKEYVKKSKRISHH